MLEGEGIFSHTLWMLLNKMGVKFSQSHSMCSNFPENFLFLTVGLTLSSVYYQRLSEIYEMSICKKKKMLGFHRAPLRSRISNLFPANGCGKSITLELDRLRFKSYLYH